MVGEHGQNGKAWATVICLAPICVHTTDASRMEAWAG
jgi:hypothetical protein